MMARRLTCPWLVGNKQQVLNDVSRNYANADRDYSEIHKLAAEHAQRDAKREVKIFPSPSPRSHRPIHDPIPLFSLQFLFSLFFCLCALHPLKTLCTLAG